MAQLEHIRLRSLGHPNARYENISLNFSNEEGRPEHTVLVLRNGGGKSSLIALYFALLVPGARQFINKERKITDYVPAGTSGLLITQWRLDDASPTALFDAPANRRILGVQYEHTNAGQFRSTYFSIKVTDNLPGATLATLPVTTRQGDRERLLTHDELKGTLDLLNSRAPGEPPAQHFDSQAAWERHLSRDLGFSDTLRKLQASMNLREAAADEQFKFKTDKQLLHFLFRHALPTEAIHALNDTLNTKREAILELKTKARPTLAFAEDTIAAITPITRIKQQRQQLKARAQRAINATHALKRQTEVLHNQQANRVTALKDEHALAVAAHEQLNAEIRLTRWQQAAADHRAAELTAEEALAARKTTEAQRQLAEADHHAWQRAGLLARQQRAQRRIEELRAQRAALAETSDAQAALHALRNAAAHYANALAHESATQEEAQARAAQARNAALAASDAARVRLDALNAQEGSLRERKKRANETISETEEHQTGLERAGIIPSGVTPQQAANSTKDHLDAATSREHQATIQINRLQAEAAAVEADLREARTNATRSEITKEQAHQDYAKALAALADVRDDPSFKALIPEDWDPENEADPIANRLEHALQEATQTATAARLDHREGAIRHERMLEERLLPAEPSIREGVSALQKAGVQGAMPASRYIAERTKLAPAAHALASARRSPLASHSILVPPTNIDAARATLKSIEHEFDTPVLLVTPKDLEEDASNPGEIFGPGNLARYHYQAAAEATERSHLELEQLAKDLDRAEAHQRLCDAAHRTYHRFRDAYPPGSITRLERARDEAHHHHLSATAKRDALEERAHHLHQAQADERRALEAAKDEKRKLESALERLKAFIARDLPKRQAAEQELAAVTTELQRLPDAINQANLDFKNAQEAAQLAAREGETAQKKRDDAHSQLARLQAEHDLEAITPTAGDLHHLKQLLEDANNLYSGMVTDDRLDGELHAVTQEHKAAEEAFLNSNRSNRHEAQKRLDTLEGLDADIITKHQIAAEDAYTRARDAATTALHEHTAAQERLKVATRTLVAQPQPADGSNPPLDTPAAAQAYAQARALHANQLRQQADIASATITKAQNDLHDAEKRKLTLANHMHRLDDLINRTPIAAPEDTQPDEHLTIEAIPALITQRQQELNELQAEAVDLDRELDQARRRFHLALNKAEYSHIQQVSRKNLLDHPASDLEQLSDEILNKQEQLRKNMLEHIASTENAAAQLVDALANVVNNGFQILTTINRSARLTEADGTARQLIRIKGATPPATDEMRKRLLALLESLLREDTRSSEAMHVALRAMDSCLDNPKVELQHPDISKTELLGVDDLPKTSGGENLTAVLIIYFALVRAASHRSRSVPTTTLWLDNPIGSSSSPRFLRVQHRFAEQMGVQLIYSTALLDHEALSVLPNIIWLRNEERGLTTGHSYVTHDTNHPGIQKVRMLRQTPHLDESVPT